jgi:hypothetical protein
MQRGAIHAPAKTLHRQAAERTPDPRVQSATPRRRLRITQLSAGHAGFLRYGTRGPWTEGLFSRQTCKPDSVEDGHSSWRRLTTTLQRPTRNFHPSQRTGWGPRPGLTRRAGACRPYSRLVPYLVLLRVGFTLPPALPPERCALTAPFHPYLDGLRRRGGIFSVALAVPEP